MLKYDADVKGTARRLRKNLTDSEKALWSRLRNKQLLGVQFHRQKPIGRFIVDFLRQRQGWSLRWMDLNTGGPTRLRLIDIVMDTCPP